MDLKKYCIDKALAAGAGADLVKVAQELHDWLEGEQAATKPGAQAVRQWKAPSLTATQKAVLKVVIDMHGKDQRINGTELARHIKGTPNNSSTHLNNLVRKGYLKRQGNKYWPVRTGSGEELPVVITKLPAAAANGYKPLTAKLGHIARMR